MKNALKKAAFYVRVSTDLQDYSRQVDDLKQAAQTYGYEGPIKGVNLFEDKISGFKERENFALMLKYIEENNIPACFVWELSRIARNLKLLVNSVSWFEERGINLYVHSPNFWLLDDKKQKTAAASFSISLLGAFAEQEARQMQARFRSRRIQYTASGKFIGGSILFGYAVDKDKTFIINNEVDEKLGVSPAQIVRELFSLYLKYKSINKVAAICKARKYPALCCRESYLMKLLHHTGYIGEVQTKLGKRKMPPLIERETFFLVQDQLKANRMSCDKTTRHVKILGGILKCPECGSSNSIIVASGYMCNRNVKIIKYKLPETQCSTPTIDDATLNGIIWEYAKPLLWHIKNQMEAQEYQEGIKNEIHSLEKDIADLSEVLVSIEKRKNKLNIIFENDGIDQEKYSQKVKSLNNEMNVTNRNIDSKKAEIKNKEALATKKIPLPVAIEEIEAITDLYQIKEFLEAAISEINLYRITKTENVIKIIRKDKVIEYLLYSRYCKKRIVSLFKPIDIHFDEKNRKLILLTTGEELSADIIFQLATRNHCSKRHVNSAIMAPIENYFQILPYKLLYC